MKNIPRLAASFVDQCQVLSPGNAARSKYTCPPTFCNIAEMYATSGAVCSTPTDFFSYLKLDATSTPKQRFRPPL